MTNSKIQLIKDFYSLDNGTLAKICGVDRETIVEWSKLPFYQVKHENYHKINELFQITREVNPNLDKKLFWHYVIYPLKEYPLDKSNEKTLVDMFIENQALDTMMLKEIVQLAFDKTLEREEEIKLKELQKFNIPHTEVEMEAILEENLASL